MSPILVVLDTLLSFATTQREWFWLCIAIIVIGTIAVVANLFEPSHASF